MRRATKASASRLASSAQCTSSTTSTVAALPSISPAAPSVSSSSSAVKMDCAGPSARARANAGRAERLRSCTGPNGRGVSRSSHAPSRTRTPVSSPARNVRTTDVLPMPAPPLISATRPRPATAAANAAPRSARADSRSSSRIPARYGGGDPARNRRSGRGPVRGSSTVRSGEVGTRVPGREVRRGRGPERNGRQQQQRPAPDLDTDRRGDGADSRAEVPDEQRGSATSPHGDPRGRHRRERRPDGSAHQRQSAQDIRAREPSRGQRGDRHACADSRPAPPRIWVRTSSTRIRRCTWWIRAAPPARPPWSGDAAGQPAAAKAAPSGAAAHLRPCATYLMSRPGSVGLHTSSMGRGRLGCHFGAQSNRNRPRRTFRTFFSRRPTSTASSRSPHPRWSG